MEFPEYSFLSVLVFDFIAPVTSQMAVSSLITFSLCPSRTLTWRDLVGDECYAMLCYAKSLQSCPTLCDPIDGSPPGSSIPGILQARTLEWVSISSSNA